MKQGAKQPFLHLSISERERHLRIEPRVTLPLLFCSLFSFRIGQDRKDIRGSRRCRNVRKQSRLRSCGKRCLRAVGKSAAFPSGRECLFSISGAAVFHISIAQNGQRTLLSVAFPCRKMYNEYS